MTSDARSNLKAFAQSGEEAAFAKVVEELGGMVFASALQRTGDRGMAEEVAQNVFAILARKAKRVAKHTSLEGWLFTTTRLEAITAMRKRGQHQRKIDALTEAAETQSDMTAPEADAWTDALPHLNESLDRLGDGEREILLARFVNNSSFKEIAQRFGKSEAACKMRVKRSLEKLNSWLSSRGVRVSAVALASGLTTEWSKAAAPAKLATNALAAAQGVTASTVLTNTLLTMNTMKQGGLVAATVLAIGSVPTFVQHSKGNDLRRQLEQLESDTGISTVANLALSDMPAETQYDTPAAKFLRRPFPIGDPAKFAKRLARAQSSNDLLEISSALAAIGRLSDKELEQLIADIATSDASENSKNIAQRLLAHLAGMREEVGRSVFDEALANSKDVRGLEEALATFARESPSEALRWYYSRLENGMIDGKGTETSKARAVVEGLVAGLVQSDPPAAVKLLDDLESSERIRVEPRMVAGLLMAGRAGNQLAHDYANAQADRERRGDLVKRSVVHAVNRGYDMDEAARYAREIDMSELTRGSTLSSIPQNVDGISLEEHGNWLANQLGPHESGTIEGFFYHSMDDNPDRTLAWMEALPPGEARDRSLEKHARMLHDEGDTVAAIAQTDRIENDERRHYISRRLLRFWVKDEPEAARAAAAERGIELR